MRPVKKIVNQQAMKIRKFIKLLLVTVVIIMLASVLVYYTDAESFSLFDPLGLFTYVGVLLGFAITIYTFTLSLVDNIKDGIHRIENKSNADKEKMINAMINGFEEMKDNIMLLFLGLVTIVIFALLKLIPNPYFPNVSKYQIPDIALLATFFFCMCLMFDLIRALFNLSETKLFLMGMKQFKEREEGTQQDLKESNN